MKYGESKFSVGVGSQAFRDNYERMFGTDPTTDLERNLIRAGVRTRTEEFALWATFAQRVSLTFPFQVDVLVSESDRDRVKMGVQLHVLDRDTREPITVLTQRHCAAWTNDADAIEMLRDLLEIALKHETNESLRLDGKLVNDVHSMR
jgi:hypothetical protein